MRRLISSTLVAVLVLLSPGLPCYQAFAATIKSSSGAGRNNVRLSVTPKLAGKIGPAFGASGLSLGRVQAGLDARTLAVASGAPSAPSGPGKDGQAKSEPGLASAQSKLDSLRSGSEAKALSDPKADKAGALSWIFDRFKKKTAQDSGQAVSGKESDGPKSLAKQTSKETRAGQPVPPPSTGQPSQDPEKGKPWYDLSEFNSSEKAYMIGQAVFLVALTAYMAALPLLVHALTGSSALTGVARAVHYWTFAGAALFAGPIVEKSPMKRVLVGGAVTRAAIFGLIGALAVPGLLSWHGFLALIGVNALVVSMHHLVDLDAAGAAKVFDSEAKIKRAGYLYDAVSNTLMLLCLPVMGLGMDLLSKKFGAVVGPAAGYALFASLMGVVSWIYASKVKVIGEKVAAKVLLTVQGIKGSLGELLSPRAGKVGAVLVVLGALGLAAIPFAGLSAAAAAGALIAGGVIGLFHWETVKIIAAQRALLVPAIMATVTNFMDDALTSVILPTFALDILLSGGLGSGLVGAATKLGGLLASGLLLGRAEAVEKKLGAYKFMALLTAAAAFAVVPSIGLWALKPSLAIAVPMVLAMRFVTQPLVSRTRALLQAAIKNDPKASAGIDRIFSLITFLQVLAAGAGGLGFAWLFQHGAAGGALHSVLGADAPMKAVSVIIAGMSVLYLGGLRWMKSTLEKKPEGPEGAALAKLDSNLEKMGLAPARKVVVDDAVSADRPTVAILAPASLHKLAILQEGGRQSPGDVHLALDPSWLKTETGADGKNRLVLTKGLYFDRDGRATLAEYKTPRPVRYFADFYTPSGNDRDDGVPLEKDLDIPMSSSAGLEKVTNDKLLTRMLLAARGIAVPATLAFVMAAHPLAAQPGGAIRAVPMPQGRAAIESGLAAFLKTYEGAEVVIKPSGPQFHSARGVKFFPRGDLAAMTDHILALSKDPLMSEDGAVLVDARLTPLPLYLRTGEYREGFPFASLNGLVSLDVIGREDVAAARFSPKEEKDWNFRVLAARAPWGGTVTTGIFARAGAWGGPTTAEPANPEDAAAFVRFEDVVSALREQHGLLKTDAEAEAFRAELEAMGRNALQGVIESESRRALQHGEPRQAQTDYIGLDVMVTLAGGKLVPQVIEVNDHDAGGQRQLDLFYPERAGEHSREWVATMLERARRDALKGKRIVVVGAGYENKRFIFEEARKLGVSVVLVDKEGWAKDLVGELVPVDTSKREEALSETREKLLRSARKNGEIDGITTFWEDDVPLTARLAESFGLPYHTVAAADAVRNKFLSREVMKDAGLEVPRYRMVKTAEDFEAAMDAVGFPAVLKPAFGAAAMSVVRVDSKEDGRKAFARIRQEVSAANDSIYNYGDELVLDQYLVGPEFDADVELQGGEPVSVTITDNWPTREPSFLATGASLPSRAFSPEQQARIKDYVASACKALGLRDGVVHIEGKLTQEGPRLFDPNGRMGGHYVPGFVKKVWGKDLVADSFMIAAGIPIGSFKPAKPLAYLEGEFTIPERSGILKSYKLDARMRQDPGFFDLEALKAPGQRVAVPPEGYDRVGMLTAQGQTSEEAQRNLDKLRAALDYRIEPDRPAPAPAAPKSARAASVDDFITAAKDLFYPAGQAPAVAVARSPRVQGVPAEGEMHERMALSPLTNPERERAIRELFLRAGAKPEEIVSQDAGRGRHNLYVVKKGRTDKVVVVGGHHDKVSAGAGTIDNWTGSTMVVNLYQAMRDVETEDTMVFIAFAREEEGLIGSKVYVDSLPEAKRAKVSAMINLDTLAVNGTFSWKNNSDRPLLDLARSVADKEKLDLTEATLDGGDADSSSFRDAGIPAITLYGASEDIVFDIIHSEKDTMAVFSMPHYRNAYFVALAMIKALDQGFKPSLRS